ncbi:MAG: SDR family oxidoreductase [Deltaproteobacteria bacterium]|nr:SDR family oxidoreductase [Deltaproteobacteria bacterium]
MFSVKDRVVMIAGCTDDVARAIGIDMAQKGARLVLVDNDLGKLEPLAKQIEEKGGQAKVIKADLTTAAEVKTAVVRAEEAFGRLDILINNFDMEIGHPLSTSSIQDWEVSLKYNIYPVVLVSLEVISRMRRNKYGRIINIGSLYSLGFPNKSSYSTAKSGVFGLTRSFALELAKDGITVNQILKGDIRGSQEEMTEEDEGKLAKGIPVQRLGKPEDLAYAVSYLASDESKYITGQTLFVCGGKSLYCSMSA